MVTEAKHYRYQGTTSVMITEEVLINNKQHHRYQGITSVMITEEVLINNKQHHRYQGITSVMITEEVLINNKQHHRYQGITSVMITEDEELMHSLFSLQRNEELMHFHCNACNENVFLLQRYLNLLLSPFSS